mmetsp:Transcript_42032/g.64392  ORF Transcript_42032/g.64392 Transcript_42032/m.64392 type:complete len:215 (+) Transcript_42032:1110-1754(+)
MMSTGLLTLNMPTLVGEYGAMSQFDVVTLIDPIKFSSKNKKSQVTGFSIDENGGISGNLNLVSFLKIAPDNVSAMDTSREGVKKLANSTEWIIARTIYSTITVKGQVKIEKLENGNSELSAELVGVDFSKMDIYKGDTTRDDVPPVPRPYEENDEEFSEDADDDDDEDDDDDDKTQEGGLIQALINMQIRPRIKSFLPKIKQEFTEGPQESKAS